MLLFLEVVPYLLVFIFGITVGSFLNVCIFRLPLGESVITGPSHCMTCKKKLKWYDMAPVFSWLLLGGKCRYCKSRISPQYPVIEALNGFLWVLVFAVNGLNALSLIYCLMASALLTLGVIDWRTYEIPLCINIFLGILGILALLLDGFAGAGSGTFAAAFCPDMQAVVNHLVGAVCVSVPLEILYVLSNGRAIGGGDVKLMASCGLILGWPRILLAFVLGCILGSVIHLLRMRLTRAGRVLALGPYLSLGIFLAALFGNAFISWYLGLLVSA